MKQRSATFGIKGLVTKSTLVAAAVLLVSAAPFSAMPKVHADQFTDKINALQAQIDQYQGQANVLQGQVATLQGEIDSLQSQENMIQDQINLSQLKYDQLVQQIADTTKKISDNKDALGTTLADMYVDNTISPMEMLASAKNIGDYVDKQSYRSSVGDKLQHTINTIKTLQTQLEQQKVGVQRTLADQQNSRNALASKQAERAGLLAQTQGEEASYQQLVSNREDQKLQVQQQQQAAILAAIAAAGGGSRGGVVLPGTSGGYPWNSSNCYVDGNAWSHGGSNGDGGDGMGYGCRQCVSYVAWRVLKETGYAATYWGNAYDWALGYDGTPNSSSAARAGFEVSRTPRAHAAGVITSGGSPGHIVWVESVDSGAGTMIVSQYNYWNAGGPGWGNYSRMQVPIGTYQYYVYF